MQIGTVRRELANAVRTAVPELNATGFMPSKVAVPHFAVGEVELDMNRTMTGSDQAVITCYVLVSRGEDDDSQALLDEFMSRSGPRSVRAALLAARGAPGELALNGAADDLGLLPSAGYRLYQVGEYQYFGATLRVQVIGS